jgi:Tfp pilus assembly protein PilF
MKREPALSDLPSADVVELALAQVEGSAEFRSSPRHRALLRHLVARRLADDAAALKETVIAVEVFGRPADRFDPREDTIVRVEMRRLRTRLAHYYATEGRGAALRFELTVGSYWIDFRLPPAPPADAEHVSRHARDLIERGEHFLRLPLTPEHLTQALDRFEAACAESPGCARAHVGRGRAWLNRALSWTHPPGPAADQAAAALRQALLLDPLDATAHALLAVLQDEFEWNWPAAQRGFERAAALAPDEAFVHAVYGFHLIFHDQTAQAERELQTARRRDPHYLNTRRFLATLRVHQGRLDEAEQELAALRDIAPDSMAAVALDAVVAMARGDARTAVLHLERACALAPGHANAMASLAGALGAAGRMEDADAMLARLQRECAGQPVSPYVMAITATRCSRIDAAFMYIAQALDQRDPNAFMLPTDPSFAPLRGDARWPAAVARLRPSRHR